MKKPRTLNECGASSLGLLVEVELKLLDWSRSADPVHLVFERGCHGLQSGTLDVGVRQLSINVGDRLPHAVGFPFEERENVERDLTFLINFDHWAPPFIRRAANSATSAGASSLVMVSVGTYQEYLPFVISSVPKFHRRVAMETLGLNDWKVKRRL